MEVYKALGKSWVTKMLPEVMTFEGKMVNFLNPDPLAMTDEAIAHGLSHVCRFGAQTNDFYSVAQHSVNVAKWLVDQNLPMEVVRAGLFHDAQEAFIGDVASPLKQLIPDYKVIEDNMQRVILQSRQLAHPLPREVHVADAVMLLTEAGHFMPKVKGIDFAHGYPKDIRPRHINDWFSIPLGPSEARALWLDWEAFSRV